jgi:hypothetical protein
VNLATCDQQVRSRGKRLKDLSPAGRLWASFLISVSLAVVVAAERDIQRRPAAEVRGSKPIWRVVCLNAVGAVSYFRWGRRET